MSSQNFICDLFLRNESHVKKTMELAHIQPKLFDTEHARGRKLQTEKIAFEVRCHAST